MQKVADLKVADILKSPLFLQKVTTELEQIWKDRESARKESRSKGLRLKTHAIDYLHEQGILEPGRFVVEYAKVLEKVSSGFPRSWRDTIQTLGSTAYVKTVQEMLDNEKVNNDDVDGYPDSSMPTESQAPEEIPTSTDPSLSDSH